MIRPEPKYTKEEFARRASEIFEQHIKSKVAQEQSDRFLAIDIDSGDYEVADRELDAINRLRERAPNSQIWLRRVGSESAHRLGSRSIRAEP